MRVANLFPFLCSQIHLIYSINIDTKFPTIFRGEPDSYFGFTVGLHSSGQQNRVLIGAPKSANPTLLDATNPGSFLKCSIENGDCQHVELEKPGDERPQLKDNMLLGWSMDVQQREPNNIAVCAPSWRKIMNREYPVYGACYLMDRDLTLNSIQKLTPLDNDRYFGTIPSYKFLYAYGQAGFSVAFDKFSEKIVLGAPGFAEWIGTAIPLPLSGQNEQMVLEKPTKDLSNKENLYFGYSIASGQFGETGESYYAAGAPRDGDLKGRVYVFQTRLERNKWAKMNITEYREGEQFGEYFGYSVLSVDLNGDQITDLIVGSPFYNIFKSGGENGRIYSFLGSSRGLNLGCKTSGDGKKGARFGSALSDIGDLNQDGYNDIAVGAPYEDGGVVYIYHGSSQGLKCIFSQKITASQVGVKGPGFGMSLSKGLDIDNNHYPDLIVGSYGDDTAVLLKSRPVIRMEATLSSTLQAIDLKSPNCVPRKDSKADPCFRIKICLIYEGKYSPAKTAVFLNISVDEEFLSVTKWPRGFFPSTQGNPQFKINREIELDANLATCIDTDVFILSEQGSAYMDPLSFVAVYGLVQSNQDRFCANCPVTANKDIQFVELKVPFSVGCGGDYICQSDLQLRARIPQLDNQKELIIGVDYRLTLEITVTNIGESAYAPTVDLLIPRELILVNQGPCTEMQNTQGNENFKLQCKLNNPFQNGQKETFEVKLDSSNVKRDGIAIIKANATTVSQELTPMDNAVEIALPFVTKAELRLIGIANPKLVPYSDENEKNVLFTHSYEIVSKFTPVPGAKLVILIPGFEEDGIHIINVTSQEVNRPLSNCINTWYKKDDDIDIVDGGNGGGLNIAKRSTDDQYASPKALTMGKSKQVTREFNLDCETTKCEYIECHFGKITKDDSVKIIVSGFANLALVVTKTKNPQLDMVYLKTNGKVYALNEDNVYQTKFADNITVTTTMTKEGYGEAEPVSLWIIIASIIGGLIILILIFVLLLKIGFFKREKHEQLAAFQQNDKLLNDRGEANSPGTSR